MWDWQNVGLSRPGVVVADVGVVRMPKEKRAQGYRDYRHLRTNWIHCAMDCSYTECETKGGGAIRTDFVDVGAQDRKGAIVVVEKAHAVAFLAATRRRIKHSNNDVLRHVIYSRVSETKNRNSPPKNRIFVHPPERTRRSITWLARSCKVATAVNLSCKVEGSSCSLGSFCIGLSTLVNCL